jgi:adenylosuccinate lyase
LARGDGFARSLAHEEGSFMIPRYARAQMVSIWSPETKFRIWFEIEAHATDKLAELGVVPKEAAAKIWEKGRRQIRRGADRRHRGRGQA